MFRRSTPALATPGTTRPITADQPHDTCFRCGRPTPLGVPLCEHDNPARIKGPSTTQVHGMILGGVIAGFVIVALLAGLAGAGVGPFPAAITGQATQTSGGIEVVVSVTNTGTRAAGASCRVSRGGVPGAGDTVFFTEPIPAGETRTYTQLLPAPATGPTTPTGIAVRCN